MKKDKKILIIVIAALVVIIVAVVLFLTLGKNKTSQQAQVPQEQPIQVVPTISPEEIGFSLTAGKAGHTVILEVAKITGIKTVEYTLSYLDKNDIERGAYGQLDLKKAPAIKEITLGTCSDVCHYDEGVSSVKMLLKVTKSDDKIYQLENTLEL
jgi:hypothetical protein